jgi:hypothetical protein
MDEEAISPSHWTDKYYAVVSLSPADNAAGPVWSRPRDVNRTVMTSPIGFSRPGPGCVPWLRARVMRSSSRSPNSPPLTPTAAAATVARDRAALLAAFRMWSVNPAAIAGVHGRHNLAEPLPLVIKGCVVPGVSSREAAQNGCRPASTRPTGHCFILRDAPGRGNMRHQCARVPLGTTQGKEQ